MEGGNETTNGSVVTQFAEGKPKSQHYQKSIGLWLFHRFVRLTANA
ncbi:MAG: hypothetical protein IJG38_03155 [Thermoguttaceae bacterium]|nr:hypothetical protein [Thermoguttaceae bacterium]